MRPNGLGVLRQGEGPWSVLISLRRAGFPSIIKLRIGAGGFGELDGGGWAFAQGLSGRSDGTIGEQGVSLPCN